MIRAAHRPADPRHPIVLPALCWQADGATFHAVTVDVSAGGIRLRSATVPRVDTRLGCSIRDVGMMEADVVWAQGSDFTVRVTGRGVRPGDVARRLVGLAHRQSTPAETVRVHRRIVPRHRAVTVVRADGTELPARILNLSASGVALTVSVSIADGETITVGRRRATVVRQIAEGIGATFLEPLDEAVGEHTVL